MELRTTDWKTIEYTYAWELQTSIFEEVINAKLNGLPYVIQIIMCEHPHLYTMGRSGKDDNTLLNDEQLKETDATLFPIDFDAVIRSHVPGLLFSLPLVNLHDYFIG